MFFERVEQAMKGIIFFNFNRGISYYCFLLVTK